MKKKLKNIIIAAILFIVIIGVYIAYSLNSNNLEYISYKEFNEKLESGNIENVLIEDNNVKFNLKNDDKEYYTENPKTDDFKEKLLLKGVSVEINSTEKNIVFALDLMFYFIFFGAVAFGIYKLTSSNNNTFKVVKHTNVKFDDIAGMDDLKKEMMQIVEILKKPKEYKEKGIRQTKGIIFEGTPGNGKTLFAKALAEETDVNFIATKGADFQSAIMSMGAKKLKLFSKKLENINHV